MSIYQQLLQYFLSSQRYFLDFADSFYEAYGYRGECGQYEEYNTPPEYDFYREEYQIFQEKEMKDEGFHLQLPDEKIGQYFSALTDDEQLFAVIFAHWRGLPESQISQIANPQMSRVSWQILNFFLSHPEHKRYEKNSFKDCGKYFVIKSGQTYPAQRKGNMLVLPDCGERLFIR